MKEKRPELVYEDSFRRILTELIKAEAEARDMEITAKEQADLVLDLLDFYQDTWTRLLESTVSHHLDISVEAYDDDDDDEETADDND